ncbi:peptide-methionine (R)-S-oxide reductase MsrB [Kushneria indalinina]|uniref:Peptide methionine sulfoxide reductase MsrB n=1 Tax=Kushneria indalinina DSM 14324 TaxID=1122140 RepID=A0A3D9DVV9_9GAMM|nr:peptide-methionine (R)-S-oxide reductase MsrB [Kushneria indalinina]REC94484.1 peptide-methionine (R)-S-oxide reductase [Kushneria indalinina DSM 14324]
MDKVHKSDSEWREALTDEQYRVTRQAGTERPYTGDYQVEPVQGIYHCVCCNAPLFENEHKFESHCGWPSFDRPLADAALEEHTDDTMGMRRIEVTCRRCDAHLGHVFPDGPRDTTGLRYCINSVAMTFHQGE